MYCVHHYYQSVYRCTCALLLKRVSVHYVLLSYGTDVLAQARGRALGYGLGPCKWWLVMGLIVNWVLTYVCIMRGAESAGKVGQCRLVVSKPELKAPLVSVLETKTRYTAFKCCFQIQLAPLHQGSVDHHAAPVPAPVPPPHQGGACRMALITCFHTFANPRLLSRWALSPPAETAQTSHGDIQLTQLGLVELVVIGHFEQFLAVPA